MGGARFKLGTRVIDLGRFERLERRAGDACDVTKTSRWEEPELRAGLAG